MMNRNQDSAQTAVRTRRLMLKPSSQGEEEFGVNVLPVGTHLGEFEIKGLIGEGGFGIVYLAYDHSLERQVALKEYMPSGLATRTTSMAVSVRSKSKIDTFTAGLKSFINEARMLAQFDSPALVKVHSFWEGNGTAYMVMPYYEGITLKQALHAQRIKPTEGWIRMLLADLCDAIDILHRAHCLHRDIAPDNILLLKDGRPLLLDFGAARRVIGDLTQCFTAILKPGFAPIEQYADIAGLRQGAWTDIYALAAVVYYLITGKAPPASVARMVHDEMTPACEAGKGRYSEAFLATIDKALSVRPEQRFHSIEELRRALNIMEPEPRTVPYPGGEWSTTVARTVPVAPPAEGKFPAPPPEKAAGDDVTAIAPPMQPADPAPPLVSRAAPPDTTAYAGIPNKKDNPRGRHSGPASGAAAPAPQAAAGTRPRSGATPRMEPRMEPRMDAPAPAMPEPTVATQMAGKWQPPDDTPQMPPHRHEQDATVPRRRDRQGWLVLGLLFTVGIGAGIYLGTNRSWDGLSEQAIDAESRAPEAADGQPQASAPQQAPLADQTLPAEPPVAGLPGGETSSGSSDSSAASGAPGAATAPEQSPTAADRQRSEIEAWKLASNSNKAGGYESYLREYPEGRFVAIARLRLERLQAEATLAPKPPPAPAPAELARKPEAPPAAVSKPTPPAAEARRPAPPIAEAVKPGPVPPQTKPEEAAWTRATGINSAASYQEYLRKYPKGGYAALARDRLASMKSGATASAPAMPEQKASSPATPADTIALAPGGETNAPSPQARQAPPAGAAQADSPASPAAAPASEKAPPATSSPAPSTAAESPSTTVPLAATAPPASPVATASPSASPPQVSPLPSRPQEAARASESPAAAAAQNAGTDTSKPDSASLPPLASIKRQDAVPPGEAADTAGGTIKFADQTMTGNFTVDKSSGLVSGKGKISWSNGDRFEGTLVRGSKEGKGKFTWNSGQRYSGDWANDVPNGNGTFIFPDGSRYEGQVKDGFPHGTGTTRFKNGIVYSGDWVRGKTHGHGRYIWSDGSYWEGEFKNDRKTENGRMYFPNKSSRNTVGAPPGEEEIDSGRTVAAAVDEPQTEENH